MMYKEAVARYLGRSHNTNIYPKAILFDMDGVLFDSMPYHADSWHTVMERYGLHLSREEAFLHEGRTPGRLRLISSIVVSMGGMPTRNSSNRFMRRKARNLPAILNRSVCRALWN